MTELLGFDEVSKSAQSLISSGYIWKDELKYWFQIQLTSRIYAVNWFQIKLTTYIRVFKF